MLTHRETGRDALKVCPGGLSLPSSWSVRSIGENFKRRPVVTDLPWQWDEWLQSSLHRERRTKGRTQSPWVRHRAGGLFWVRATAPQRHILSLSQGSVHSGTAHSLSATLCMLFFLPLWRECLNILQPHYTSRPGILPLPLQGCVSHPLLYSRRPRSPPSTVITLCFYLR